MTDDLPRQLARTARFSTGIPHALAVAANGTLVTYLRDGALWTIDGFGGGEQRIGPADAYSVARTSSRVAILHQSELWAADLGNGRTARLPVTDVDRAEIDPTGSWVAYVRAGAVRCINIDGTGDRALAEPETAEVTWGLPEFAARMSMGRDRGFWWSPEGRRLLVARVDESPVPQLWLADPARPGETPRPVRYPAAGSPNADVSLHVVHLSGNRREVAWDRGRLEYLVRVDWSTARPLLAVQSRDQRIVHVLEVDPETGATALVREVTDPAWVDVADGVPTRTESGDLVWVERDAGADTDRLLVGGRYVTPAGLQVRSVRAVDGDAVTFVGQRDPVEEHVYQYDGDLNRLSDGRGVHGGVAAAGITVLDSSNTDGRTVSVGGRPLRSTAEDPVLDVRMELLRVGNRELCTAVFRPSWHERGSGRLPVLVNSYAGPGRQVVQTGRSWHHLLSQWFAEQGFVVVSTDGRGTPGRGPAFAREIAGDLVGPILDDQVAALHAVADRDGDLDLERVAVRGWSFGGFLAAAAVLHRPDQFHAALAGAAVSDQRMYDTYWKERFLGHPDTAAEAYRRCSLLPYAASLSRPLMLVHGLADTNVWSAHSLRLSAALTAAGRPHTVLPLAGQGHRIADQDVAATLPRLELAFLRQALSRTSDDASASSEQAATVDECVCRPGT